MILGPGRGVQIEADTETAPTLHELLMEITRHLLRRAPFLLGAHRDRRAVLVGAGDHEHPVAGQPVITGEDIWW